MKLLFLQLPPFPTISQLWSNLAAIRHTRRRLSGPTHKDASQFASFFGLNEEQRKHELRKLILREKLIEAKIKRA